MPSIMQMDEQEFGYEIIRARRQMKISQAQPASKLGISIRTLESWEEELGPLLNRLKHLFGYLLNHPNLF